MMALPLTKGLIPSFGTCSICSITVASAKEDRIGVGHMDVTPGKVL